MIKKKNKIKVVLTTGGSLDKLELPVKLHKDSINTTDIEVFVPITINRTSTSFVKIYGNAINEKGEVIWSSDTYSINFKALESINKFEYAVYEDRLPDEFSSIVGDLNLTIAYADLDEDGNAIDILPSQTINLHVSGAGFNGNGIKISNYDATVARLNLLSELAILKVNIDKELPLGVVFDKEGYKSPFYKYYSDIDSLQYSLPVDDNSFENKSCTIIADNIVRDKSSPEVIGYQTEFAYFDNGICQRTNKYNISQGNINNFVLLELGDWNIVNKKYFDPLFDQVEKNVQDIEKLFRFYNTGVNPLGEFPSQSTLPTDQQLNSYVESQLGREPQNGDEFTFVLNVEDGTDIIYLLKYSEVTFTWSKIEFPTIEPAKNGSMGIIKGTADEDVTTTRKVLVSINNGELESISHVNENGDTEDISGHLNRNSNNIKENQLNIDNLNSDLLAEVSRAKESEIQLDSKITNEIERSKQEESSLLDKLDAEIQRAKQAEEENAQSIINETSRADTEEKRLESSKLDKQNIDSNFLQDILFSVNGDVGVANILFKNPVTGQMQPIEVTVTSPASSTNTGLMTSDMVNALNKAKEDIESLKYVGKQIASFASYAEAELFDFSTIENININDYFIVQVDESRTEPLEKNKTTKYVCINEVKPITLDSFRFQGVVTTVNIQVATEDKLGGVLSVNTNGYIYVENNGAMKLVGYDNILTSINNLFSSITAESERAVEEERRLESALSAETSRAMSEEQKIAQSVIDERNRAQTAEQELVNTKASKSEIPTKLSQLENDGSYAKTNQIPTKLSQLENDSDFASITQIPTNNNQLTNGAGYVSKDNSNIFTKAQLFANGEKSDSNGWTEVSGGSAIFKKDEFQVDISAVGMSNGLYGIRFSNTKKEKFATIYYNFNTDSFVFSNDIMVPDIDIT